MMPLFLPFLPALRPESTAPFAGKCLRFLRKSLALLGLSLLLFFAGGCTEEESGGAFRSELVVEGWIEEGGFPIVLVSRTAVPQESPQSVEDLAVRWAKVVVSDGIYTEVLTGRYDEDYFPPYVYTGSLLRGEAGKSYTLVVGENGDTVCATTCIPLHAPHTLSVRPVPLEGEEGRYRVEIDFCDWPEERNYYKIFVQEPRVGPRYFSSFMGTFSDDGLAGKSVAVALRSMFATGFVEENDESVYFSSGHYASIKFVQIGEAEYEFWKSYEISVGSSNNLFLSTQGNLAGNVQGGKGCWYGMNGNSWLVFFP